MLSGWYTLAYITRMSSGVIPMDSLSGLREALLTGDAGRKTTWSDQGYLDWDGPNILRYNVKLLVTYKFFGIKGTVFDYRHKWIFVQVLILLVLAILTAWYTIEKVNDPDNFYQNLVGASDVLNNLSSFLLSFFVTVVIDRWWSMCEYFQELGSDARYIMQLACTYMPGEQARPFRQRVMRYAWLANAFAVLSQRRDTDLGALHSYGGEGLFALTPEEEKVMRNHSPTMRVWATTQWLSSTLLQSVAAGMLFTPEVSLALMQRIVGRIHGVNSKALNLLDRQLPFPYVHLLTVVVKVTILFISIEYGYRIGVLWTEGQYLLLCVDFMGILLVNFFYQGLLNLYSVLSRPWFEHPAHIPRFSVLKSLKGDLLAIEAVRTELPWEDSDATLELRRSELTKRAFSASM